MGAAAARAQRGLRLAWAILSGRRWRAGEAEARANERERALRVALQAELEAQAAADAAEAEDAEDAEDSEDDELLGGFVEIETEDDDESRAEDSATPDVEDGIDAEPETRNTRPWPPRLFSRKRWIGRKKDNKGD